VFTSCSLLVLASFVAFLCLRCLLLGDSSPLILVASILSSPGCSLPSCFVLNFELIPLSQRMGYLKTTNTFPFHSFSTSIFEKKTKSIRERRKTDKFCHSNTSVAMVQP